MDTKSIVQTGAKYHWKTGYDRHRMTGHFLDWENQPNPFKKYTGKPTIPLTPVAQLPEKSLWQLISPPVNRHEPQTITKDLITQLLYLTGGITATRRHGGKDFYFRAVASAGALYPSELYIGIFNAKDLEPGIYHFGADNFVLTSLRRGNFNHFLNKIIDVSHMERHPAVSFFLTGIFFRSAWKYHTRAFRYVLLDTGHLLENLISGLASVDLAFHCHYDFNDKKMGRLIGLDHQREAGLVCVNIPGNSYPTAQAIPAVDPLSPEIIAAERVSRREIVYDDILEAYRSGIREPGSDRIQETMVNDIGLTPTSWISIEKTAGNDEERLYVQSVLNRRSRRNYIRQSLSQQKFMRLLDLVCRSVQNGNEDPFACLVVGFLTGNIDGFEPGFYHLDPEKRRAGQIVPGHFLEPMAAVCLDQKWLANAAVHFMFMTNLKTLDDHYGARGYRYAMLNAGRLGQLIYLGATALGLGCCGIGALYDGEAQKLLGLNTDSALLYLVAAGPVKNRKSTI